MHTSLACLAFTDGKAVEFPPLRGLMGARDNTAKWKAAVESATKIYVIRS